MKELVKERELHWVQNCDYKEINTMELSNTYCCADSTPGLKSITENKQKLNNKHTQRTQEFMWFGKLPTSTETTEKFHYKKIGRYNSAQEHSQETQIPITP